MHKLTLRGIIPFSSHRYLTSRVILLWELVIRPRGLTDSQDAFDILGVKRTTTDNIIWLTKVGQNLNGTLEVKNTSNIELKNVQLKVANLPEGCTLTVSPIATLTGNATAVFAYTILGTVSSKTADYQKLNLKLSTNEGVNVGYIAYYYCSGTRIRHLENKSFKYQYHCFQRINQIHGNYPD